MAFCINCGQELAEGAKFCANCGASANGTSQGTQRKTTYDGEIHKCPNCGEILGAFVSVCSACGYELRGNSTSNAVKEFASQLTQAETQQEKIEIIKSFPIPNNKENILEFLILASTNINGSFDNDISAAWLIKVEQCYQKAKIIIDNTGDINQIDKIYYKIQQQKNFENAKNQKKNLAKFFLRNIMTWCGILAVIIAVIMYATDANGSMVELLGCIALIAAAIVLPKRKAPLIDYLVTALGGVIVILLGFVMENGSMAELCGGIILIIVAIVSAKSVSSKK